MASSRVAPARTARACPPVCHRFGGRSARSHTQPEPACSVLLGASSDSRKSGAARTLRAICASTQSFVTRVCGHYRCTFSSRSLSFFTLQADEHEDASIHNMVSRVSLSAKRTVRTWWRLDLCLETQSQEPSFRQPHINHEVRARSLQRLRS